MRYEGYRKIFWGFIFVFLEVHIFVIDIFPDPIGYYLIFTGMYQINNHFEVGSRGKQIALGLIYFSIPTVFLQNTSIEPISGWFFYLSVIGMFNLLLAFYIFQGMVLIAGKRKESDLLRRTEITFRVYLISMLLIIFFEPFSINMNLTEGTGYFVFSVVFGLIMNIIFLVLLSKFSKLTDDFEASSGTKAEEADRKEPPIETIR